MGTSKLKFALLAIATGLALVWISSATAVPVYVHSGANDPTTEGWTLSQSAGATGALEGGSETIGAVSHDFWRVQDSSTTDSQAYLRNLTAGDLSGNWRLEGVLRIVDSPIVPGHAVGGTSIIVSDGLNYWSFYFGNASAGPISNTGKSGPHTYVWATPVATQVDYHRYVIQFSQNGAGTADDTADFYVDGALVFDNQGRSGLWTSAEEFVYFGPNGTTGMSDANYELVRFDANLTSASVPLPGSFGLLVAGVFACAGIRRSRLNRG